MVDKFGNMSLNAEMLSDDKYERDLRTRNQTYKLTQITTIEALRNNDKAMDSKNQEIIEEEEKKKQIQDEISDMEEKLVSI